MSKKRTYWTKMNLDEARESIEVMDDAEIGRWFKAWIIGAGGKDIPSDRIQTWSLEQRAGYASGVLAFAEAQEFSQKQRDRVSARYTEKLPEVTTVGSGSKAVSKRATAKLPIEQRTTNNEQASTDQAIKRADEQQAPEMDEWVSYCSSKWADWPVSRIEAAWHAYDAKGWGPRWKGSAATAHAKAVEWGHIPAPRPALVYRELQGC